MQLQQRIYEGRTECFDIIRRKWVPLTPEEAVRQFLIHFMVEERKIPAVRISVEREITVNGLKRRYDLVEQAGRYNKTLHAPYIGVSNGKESRFFKIDFESEKIAFLEGWPF